MAGNFSSLVMGSLEGMPACCRMLDFSVTLPSSCRLTGAYNLAASYCASFYYATFRSEHRSFAKGNTFKQVATGFPGDRPDQI